MARSFQLAVASAFLFVSAAHAQNALTALPRPTPPRPAPPAQSYRDSHFGVRFRIPPGWDFSRKDRLVSTFRLDARSAVPTSEMRAVAALDVNPFPLSTLSGAFFYYSVEPHTTDRECESQAKGFAKPASPAQVELKAENLPQPGKQTQNIGGMDFAHGHDEHGGICVEARDEIYTAFRKGSCYRFDLEVNTFCTITSGAMELTGEQMLDIEGRMTGILSTVVLDWEKSGPHPVPAPPAPDQPHTPRSPLTTPDPTPPPAVAASR